MLNQFNPQTISYFQIMAAAKLHARGYNVPCNQMYLVLSEIVEQQASQALLVQQYERVGALLSGLARVFVDTETLFAVFHVYDTAVYLHENK